MNWVILLLASLVESAAADARRARFNEALNRLGLRQTRKPDLDLYTLFARLYDTIPVDTASPRVYLGQKRQEGFARMAFREMVVDLPDVGREDVVPWKLLYSVPRAGVRSDFMPLLPWMARVFADLQERANRGDEDAPEWLIPMVHAWPPPESRAHFVGLHLAAHVLTPIRDWVETTGADLNRYSLSGASAAAAAWHRQFREVPGLGEPVEGGVAVATWPDGGHVALLVERHDFVEEGAAMGHCIGGPIEDGAPSGSSSYIQASRDGKGLYVSYRGRFGVPEVTVELGVHRTWPPDVQVTPRQTLSIDQVQGPEDGAVVNRTAAFRMAAFLRAWVQPGGPGLEAFTGGDLANLGFGLVLDAVGRTNFDAVVDSLLLAVSNVEGTRKGRAAAAEAALDPEAALAWEEEHGEPPNPDAYEDMLQDELHDLGQEFVEAAQDLDKKLPTGISVLSHRGRGQSPKWEVYGPLVLSALGEGPVGLEVEMEDDGETISWSVREGRSGHFRGSSSHSPIDALIEAGVFSMEATVIQALDQEAATMTVLLDPEEARARTAHSRRSP